MKIKDFEKRYSSKGGIEKLTNSRALLHSQDYIADYFKVSKERVRQWMQEFFGSAYDKRKDRRDAVISCMIEFSERNTEEDFATAYKSSTHYKLAIAIIKKKKHGIKRWRNKRGNKK